MINRKNYRSNGFNIIKEKDTLSFIEKLKLCLMILTSKNFKPILRFNNGVEIDLKYNKIILTKPMHLHCTEDITISSEKNIIIDSGKKDDPNRPGYKYSIWLNCNKDSNGNPLKIEER